MLNRKPDFMLSGEVDNQMVAMLADTLMKSPQKKLWLFNSEGGNMPDGFAMHSLIKLMAPDIQVVGVGQIESMAIIPFLACKVRMATRETAFMVHQGTFQLELPEPQSDIPGMCFELQRQNSDYERIIAANTKLSEGQISQLVRAGTYFSAQQALEWGFIHKII